MAWSFGDSFDLYATTADMINGYWDSPATLNGCNFAVAGRFAGSQALQIGLNTGFGMVKTSGVNDAVHHICLAFRQTGAISGSVLGLALQLYDGGAAQCSVVFRQDGAILLTSGSGGGATLAIYTGAFTASNTWYAFEFEIVINNTTGSFAVRKNGNTVNDFTATSLNTQGGTANNYANKLNMIIQSITSNNHVIDDLFWQSGATPGSWLGDIRCYARMPASNISTQFTPSGARGFSLGGGIGVPAGANKVQYTQFTLTAAGTVASVTVGILFAYTGNIKCALYGDNGSGSPGAVLGTAVNIITNPVSGNVTFTFSPAVSVSAGLIWLAYCTDTASGGNAFGVGGATPAWTGTTTYASFPVANPASLSSATPYTASIALTLANAGCVSEPQQDGLTTYVFDSNPGDQDFYGVSSIASTPSTVIAATVRGYMQKSDAGTRTAAVQLKSGATTVASPTLTLTTSGWQWAWRTDTVDPATGAAWTAAGVNNAQIGGKVIA